MSRGGVAKYYAKWRADWRPSCPIVDERPWSSAIIDAQSAWFPRGQIPPSTLPKVQRRRIIDRDADWQLITHTPEVDYILSVSDAAPPLPSDVNSYLALYRSALLGRIFHQVWLVLLAIVIVGGGLSL